MGLSIYLVTRTEPMMDQHSKWVRSVTSMCLFTSNNTWCQVLLTISTYIHGYQIM